MKKGFLVLAVVFGLSLAATAAGPDENFDYLRNIFNKHEKKMGEFLIREIKSYMAIYPDHEKAPEASRLLAEVYTEMRDEDLAFAQLAKTLFLFPNSTVHSTAVSDIHKIIANSSRYKDKMDYIAGIIDGTFKSGSMADKYYSYIDFLHEVALKSLNDWTLDEYYYFISEFHGDDRVEKVQRWISDTYYEKGNETAAVNGYEKYEQLYPKSEHLPYVMIKRAGILDKEMKLPGDAITLLTQVVDKYPNTDYAATALYDRAEIKANRNNDFEGAVTDFRELVKMQPQHVKAVDALLEIARIQERRMKALKAAVSVYDEVIQGYPIDIRGIDALKESAEIALKLDDFKDAADRFAKIATQYPDYADAPKMVFKASEIAAGKLKNLHQAIEYLQIVVDKYPDTDAARQAQKDITKMKEKLNR